MVTSRAVVVSGAASGIGAAAARMLAREHFVVVALDVAEAVQDVAGEIRESGGTAYPLTGDVTDESTWHEAVALADDVPVRDAGAAYLGTRPTFDDGAPVLEDFVVSARQ